MEKKIKLYKDRYIRDSKNPSLFHCLRLSLICGVKKS